MTLPATLPQPKTWNAARIFISSTFRDMHGERNMINRFIIPKLNWESHKLNIETVPVDLRWGLPNFGSDSNTFIWSVRQVRACIEEIEKCQIFVGFLGNRYGWKPAFGDLRSSTNPEAIQLLAKIGDFYLPGNRHKYLNIINMNSYEIFISRNEHN